MEGHETTNSHRGEGDLDWTRDQSETSTIGTKDRPTAEAMEKAPTLPGQKHSVANQTRPPDSKSHEWTARRAGGSDAPPPSDRSINGNGFSVLFCRLYFAATIGVCLIRSGAVGFQKKLYPQKKQKKTKVQGRHGLGTGDHPDLLLDKGGGGGDAGTRDPPPHVLAKAI